MDNSEKEKKLNRRQFIKFSGAASAVIGGTGLGLFGYQAGKDPDSYTGTESFQGKTQKSVNREKFAVDLPTYKKTGISSRADARSDVIFSRIPRLMQQWNEEKGLDNIYQCYRNNGDQQILLGHVVFGRANGYSGPMLIAVGIDTNDTISNLKIIEHKETIAFLQKIQSHNFLAFLPIIIKKKNIYCHSICPFGAAQECLSLIGGTKKGFALNVHNKLIWLPRLFAIIFIGIGLLKQNPGIESHEIFSAFFNLTGTNFQFILLAIVVIASLFIKRPWCNYLCPIRGVTDLLHYFRNRTDKLVNLNKSKLYFNSFISFNPKQK